MLRRQKPRNNILPPVFGNFPKFHPVGWQRCGNDQILREFFKRYQPGFAKLA
jgi:hypothetical protein